LLGSEELDFVDIATAPHIHREQVLAAAEHGLHVLCQKPFATSMEEAREMIGACQTAGVRCVVNENWRWRRWYRDLKRMLERGIVGRPRYARFHFRSDSLLPKQDGTLPALLSVQPYTAGMPHLILFEWGIHLIDVMRFLFGDGGIQSVYARMGRLSPYVRGEDWAAVTLQFREGVVGVVDISWSTLISGDRQLVRGDLDPFVVEGDRGTIELDPYREDAIIVTTEHGVEHTPARPGITPAEAYQASYVGAQGHFVRCLLTGERAENEADDNLKTLEAVFAAYESAEHNQVVHLAEDHAAS
jgi:predicted dehydrogenase